MSSLPPLESCFYPKSTLNVIYACIYQISWPNGLIGYDQISKAVLAVVVMVLVGMVMVIEVVAIGPKKLGIAFLILDKILR